MTNKSDQESASNVSESEISVKGVPGKHFTRDYCYVCDMGFDPQNPNNLIQHINGTKHIKNVLAAYSKRYHSKCIYCNAATHNELLRHSHISSNKHSEFINGIISETRTKYPDNYQWNLSLDECQTRTNDPSPSKSGKATKKLAINSVSAPKLRKGIRDCYDDHGHDSIEQQLSLLESLYKRLTELNEKDHVSILFVLSSLMRTNNAEIITNGIIRICKLFAEDPETYEPSKWKMNHVLFEKMVDMMILSVNLQDVMREYDELMVEKMGIERDALNAIIGFDAEQKFLEPFSIFFSVFKDYQKWDISEFENEKAHQYFMKWSHLIFQDMMYNLRDITGYRNPNFDWKYKLQIRKLNDENLSLYGTALNIDINNTMYIRKCCGFTEKKRSNSGPFVNVTMSAGLAGAVSSLSRGSFVILFPEDMDTNIINFRDVMVGYIYRLAPTSGTATLRIANHDENIRDDCRWHLLSLGASAVSFESQFEVT